MRPGRFLPKESENVQPKRALRFPFLGRDVSPTTDAGCKVSGSRHNLQYIIGMLRALGSPNSNIIERMTDGATTMDGRHSNAVIRKVTDAFVEGQ